MLCSRLSRVKGFRMSRIIAEVQGWRMASVMCVIATAGLAASASATISDPALRFRATNASGTATLDIPLADLTFDGNGVGMWFLPAATDLVDGDFDVIASLQAATLMIRPAFGALQNTISVGFTMTAGTSVTDFFIESALFSLPNLGDTARMTAGATVTDQNSNGVTFTPLSGDAFNALFNGGTEFGDLIGALASATPGGSAASGMMSLPGGAAFSPIAPATSMQTTWNFRLTAGDQVGATSRFDIIPTPGTMSLIGIAGLGLTRRSRRR